MGDQRHAPSSLLCEGDAVPFVQVAGWAPGPVWTGMDKIKSLAPGGVRVPKGPALGETLFDHAIPARRHVKQVYKTQDV